MDPFAIYPDAPFIAGEDVGRLVELAAAALEAE